MTLLVIDDIDDNICSEQKNEAVLLRLLLAETETVAMETSAINKEI
jgi:hypothetical protein